MRNTLALGTQVLATPGARRIGRTLLLCAGALAALRALGLG